MKNKIISIIITATLAVIVVMISDLFATLSLGNFAWIVFVLWNYTSKKTDDSSPISLILKLLIGLPIGIILSIFMIYVPTLFGNNLIIKYLTVFICNGIAVLFPSKFISSIFFGIGLTFSGLGSNILPTSFNNTLIILLVTILFSTLGIIAAWSSEKLHNLNNKKN